MKIEVTLEFELVDHGDQVERRYVLQDQNGNFWAASNSVQAIEVAINDVLCNDGYQPTQIKVNSH